MNGRKGYEAWWPMVGAFDLMTGDCRFNPSHCTVEYDLGQVIDTRASVTEQYNLVTIVSWEVNWNTMRHTGAMSMVLQLWLASGRSALPFGPNSLNRTLPLPVDLCYQTVQFCTTA